MADAHQPSCARNGTHDGTKTAISDVTEPARNWEATRSKAYLTPSNRGTPVNRFNFKLNLPPWAFPLLTR
eukprot:scaffold96932_cov78-Phaeocystis_antarctica.AAC.1